MGKNKAGPNKGGYNSEEMEVGWSHPQKTKQHHKTGTHMESPRKEEKRTAEKYMEERS